MVTFMYRNLDIEGLIVRTSEWFTDARGSLSVLWTEGSERVPETEPVDDGTGQVKIPCEPEMPYLRRNWSGRRHDLGAVRHVYTTTTRPGVVKAWHYHLKQTDRFHVLSGTLMFVFFDIRDSGTHANFETVFVDARRNPMMIIVPPGVVHGWKNIGNDDACVLNLCTRRWFPQGDPLTDEYRIPVNEQNPVDPDRILLAGYQWHGRVDG